MAVDLSAIVITRNEEAHIAACLAGCLRAISKAQEEGGLRGAEVILSDSASTDRTVDIARQFPITIVQLLPDWPQSAGAGRHVGLRHARGDFILFVDGDYVLAEDWLADAIRTLRERPEVAAICGQDVEEVTGESVLLRYEKRLLETAEGEPEAIPVGLYRRSALEAAGGIHPFLKGAEDRDVAYRLRAAGYRLLRLPRTMGVHRWADEGPLDYVTYFRSVLAWSIGDGQLFRSRCGIRTVAADVRRRYANARHAENYLLAMLLAMAVLANLAAILVPPLWPIFLADAGILVALEGVRRSRAFLWREVMFRLHVVPYSLLRHAGFAMGLVRNPRSASEYPSGERIVQTATGTG